MKTLIWMILVTKCTLLHKTPKHSYLALQRALWDPKGTCWDPKEYHSVQKVHQLCWALNVFLDTKKNLRTYKNIKINKIQNVFWYLDQYPIVYQKKLPENSLRRFPPKSGIFCLDRCYSHHRSRVYQQMTKFRFDLELLKIIYNFYIKSSNLEGKRG